MSSLRSCAACCFLLLPGLVLAQASPFMTGATALQTNILILRCSASEGGGTARFASQLIGDREVTRTSRSTTRRAGELLGSRTMSESVTHEAAVMPAEVEQLPDLQGYLKCASQPAWQRVRLEAMAAWRQRAAPQVPVVSRATALEHE